MPRRRAGGFLGYAAKLGARYFAAFFIQLNKPVEKIARWISQSYDPANVPDPYEPIAQARTMLKTGEAYWNRAVDYKRPAKYIPCGEGLRDNFRWVVNMVLPTAPGAPPEYRTVIVDSPNNLNLAEIEIAGRQQLASVWGGVQYEASGNLPDPEDVNLHFVETAERRC